MLITELAWIVPLVPAIAACLYSIYDSLRYSVLMERERKNEDKHSGKDP